MTLSHRSTAFSAQPRSLHTVGCSNVVATTGAMDGISTAELQSRLALIDAELHLAAVQRSHLMRLEAKRQHLDEQIADLQADERRAAA